MPRLYRQLSLISGLNTIKLNSALRPVPNIESRQIQWHYCSDLDVLKFDLHIALQKRNINPSPADLVGNQMYSLLYMEGAKYYNCSHQYEHLFYCPSSCFNIIGSCRWLANGKSIPTYSVNLKDLIAKSKKLDIAFRNNCENKNSNQRNSKNDGINDIFPHLYYGNTTASQHIVEEAQRRKPIIEVDVDIIMKDPEWKRIMNSKILRLKKTQFCSFE